MLEFISGSREAHATSQIPDNMSSTSESSLYVNPSSCVGAGGACSLANESLSFQSNFSDVDLTGDFGLKSVTTAASNYTLPQVVILGMLAGSTSLITISGNLVVLLSFIIERSIRQPSNYFIASLAVSDLLLGSISMPFYTIYLLSGKYWPLGELLCDLWLSSSLLPLSGSTWSGQYLPGQYLVLPVSTDLWLSLDYTVCLSSIYTVFCITVDRFCSVKIPAKYRNWRTKRKVLTIICATWVIPVLVFFTSIIGWQYFVGKRTVKEGSCYVQYMEEPIFNLLLQLGYFWITLTVMCTLYAGIYRVALRLQRQSEAKHQRRTALLVSVAGGAMSKIGIEMSQQQQHEPAALAAAGDQNTVNQQQNGNNAVGGQPAEASNNVADPLPPPAEPLASSKSTKQHKRLKKQRQQCDDEEDDDDHQSSSFAFTSDSEQEDVEHIRQTKKASISAASARHRKSSGRASKKTKRRATRHTSPVVAVERAVQFVAEQRKATDDVHPPQTLDSNVACAAAQPCTLASADQAQESFDAVSGGFSNAVEASMSNCRRDHQCVFEAWRRPMPNLSPVWVRRHVGGPNRQRADCDNAHLAGTRANSVHVIVDGDDDDGRATCGCTLPSTVAGASCISGCSPTIGASAMYEPSRLSCTTTKSTTLTAQHRDRDQHQRQRRKPFVIVAALRRLPRPRRWRRCPGHGDQAGPSSAAQRTSKCENRARKSLRTITIILGAFVLCWTPWHVLSMIIGFCPPCVEPVTVIYDISYWLCYLNSPINPLCYAFANQQFKKTFLRIFRFDWHRT